MYQEEAHGQLSHRSLTNCPEPVAFCYWLHPFHREVGGWSGDGGGGEGRGTSHTLPVTPGFPLLLTKPLKPVASVTAGQQVACWPAAHLSGWKRYRIDAYSTQGGGVCVCGCVCKEEGAGGGPATQTVNSKTFTCRKIPPSPSVPPSLSPSLSLPPPPPLTEDDIWRQLPGSCHNSVN